MVFLHLPGDCPIAVMMVERAEHSVKLADEDERTGRAERGSTLVHMRGLLNKIMEHRSECSNCTDRGGEGTNIAQRDRRKHGECTLDAFCSV